MAGTYVFAGARPWLRPLFDEVRGRLPGDWHFVSEPAELSAERVRELAPDVLFFVHWSWIVPAAITDAFECVCFHLGDVPRARGGSPVQNQIVRGRRTTCLTALRMTQEVDAGPVYVQEPFALEGSAQEIYLRAGRRCVALIERILFERPEPQPQQGEPEVFERRRPDQSELPGDLPDLLAVHDFIRMLDAEGYPHAFVEHGGWRIELTRSSLRAGEVVADVRITRSPSAGEEGK